jgi:outer membrane protein assembly factor BamB
MSLSSNPDPIWSAALGETPAGPPLAVEEWLLLATHQAGAAPTWSKLRWFSLADGQPGQSVFLVGALVGGIRPIRLGKPDRSGESQDGVLVATYSADALGNQGALVALDAAGEEVWRWAPGVSGVSAPALAGSQAWVTTNTGFLAGLDLATGVEQVRIPLDITPSLAAPALALAGDVAYIPCRGPHLLAMGLGGQLRWRFEASDQPGGWLNHTPLLAREHLIAVLNRAGLVMALRLADGAPAWQVQVGPPGRDLTPLATDGERLYVGSRGGLHALELAGGRELWCFPIERGLVAAPVVAGRTVYAAGRNHCLYALDAASGNGEWRYQVEHRVEVPPLITAGLRPMAIVADQGGALTALHRPLSAPEQASAAPSLTVEVQHGELVLNTWTRLRFIVRNQGGGPARQLIIHARGGQFEGQVVDTRRITTVQSGHAREDWLDVRPLACGDSVPLRVSIEYRDATGTVHTWQDTLYLPVAPVPSGLYSQGGGEAPPQRPITPSPIFEPPSPSEKRQPGAPKPSQPAETGKKDFFVSYNRADRQWAEWIAWQLEAAGYTTIIQAWDFRPGSNFIIEMQRAAEQALRTVAVLSPDYLRALYTQPEWAAAIAQDPTGEKRTLLPVRVRKCELQGLLSQVVYIDLAGLAEEVAREKLLAGAKQGRAKPATAPGFPGIGEPSFPGTGG